MTKPYSAACDNNRQPILSIIEKLFAESRDVLEIGSGTGQHAVFFAEKFEHLVWHTSDLEENHAGIKQWLNEAGLTNTRSPISLDVTQSSWPGSGFDAVFSANAIHIMGWDAGRAMIAGVGKLLAYGGLFVLYGPFNYNNTYTSDSNARFDVWLKGKSPESGIRNFEDIEQLANEADMWLQHDYAMPANNRILCWEKRNNNEESS
jgi:cyclopropane fatty-acyl-phospholipid synthase-like methyltransferase